MGGMIRCIRNDYNLDKIENDIDKEDDFGDILEKDKNSDINDKETDENSHYADNFLKSTIPRRNPTKDSMIYNTIKT